MNKKILVISDSHGRADLVRRVCDMHPDADMLLHAGDGVLDISAAGINADGMTAYAVKGNCDFMRSEHPSELLIPVSDSEKIFLCHGNAYGVKTSLVNLRLAALSKGANIAVFGHTHEPLEKHIPLDNGEFLHMFNPGSLKLYSFGLIQIKDGNILFSHGKLKA